MGVPASTKLISNKDSLTIYTRYGGYQDDIEWTIENSVACWKKNIALIKKIIKENNELGTYNFVSWLNDFESMVTEYEKEKKVDIASVLCASMLLAHQRTSPESGENQEWLSELGAFGANYNFDLNKKVLLEDNEVEENEKSKGSYLDTYRIGEITDHEEGKSKVRFKFKDLSEEELTQKLLLLPFFMRDFFILSREFVYKEKKEKDSDKTLPMLRSYNMFSEFYNQTNEANRLYNEERKKIFDSSEKNQDIETLFMKVKWISLPIDVTGGILLSLLSIMLPGKVLPLTDNEKELVGKSSLKIDIFQYGDIQIETAEPEKIQAETNIEVMKYKKSLEKFYGVKENYECHYSLDNTNKKISYNLLESIVRAMYTQGEIERL